MKKEMISARSIYFHLLKYDGYKLCILHWENMF